MGRNRNESCTVRRGFSTLALRAATAVRQTQSARWRKRIVLRVSRKKTVVCLEPATPSLGESRLGVLQGRHEPVERAGTVLHTVQAPEPLVAAGVAAGLVDRANADFAALDLILIGGGVGA